MQNKRQLSFLWPQIRSSSLPNGNCTICWWILESLGRPLLWSWSPSQTRLKIQSAKKRGNILRTSSGACNNNDESFFGCFTLYCEFIANATALPTLLSLWHTSTFAFQVKLQVVSEAVSRHHHSREQAALPFWQNWRFWRKGYLHQWSFVLAKTRMLQWLTSLWTTARRSRV